MTLLDVGNVVCLNYTYKGRKTTVASASDPSGFLVFRFNPDLSFPIEKTLRIYDV